MLIALEALLGHISLYRRLVRDTVRHRALRRLALAVLFLLTLLLMLRRTRTRHLSPELADGVAVMMCTWMGVALFLVLALGSHRGPLHGASHLYVSRDRGFWGPPMRVGSPPEILKRVLTT